jgi:signal transduction histidine kinase
MPAGDGGDEQELARVAARDAFRVRIADAFRHLSDPAQIREVACRLLAEHLGVGRALYARVDGDAYVVEQEYCRGMAPLGHRYRFVGGSYGGEVFDATLAGRLLVVGDVREHPLTSSHSNVFEAIETRSFISVPLIRTGQWVGTFAVSAPEPREWTREDVELVTDVGERTWYAVERARAELELQRSAVRDAYRLKLADALRRSATPEACREVACRVLTEHLQVNRTVYAALDTNDYVVEHDHCVGVRSMVGRYPLSRFGRAIYDVLLAGNVMWCDDILTDERLTDEVRDAIQAIEVRSFITLPMVKNGVWVGALAVHCTGPREWTAEERELSVETAERAWFAVERARNEIEVKRAAARDAYRIRLSDALRTQTDPVAIRHAAAQVFGEYTGANRALYAQIIGDEGIVEPEYLDGVASIAGRQPYSAYCADAIAKLNAGELFVVNDSETLGDQEREAYRAIDVRSGIGFGLVKDGKWVAAFAAHSATQRTWTDDELALLRETAERTYVEVERARAEAALRESEAALRERDRRKDEFLAMLAHELRNPLSPLRTVAAVLQLAQGKPDVIEEMRLMLERQVAHMTRLVDDLLDAARMTRGTITLRRAPTSLRQLVFNAIEAHHTALADAQIALRVALPDHDYTVDVDATRIVQVLSNLLHNATKFTPVGGRIEVAARIEDRGVVLAVTDSGEGISADVLPQVFELFRQGKLPVGRRHGGLGVGLALARTLVELHGGTIALRSNGPRTGTHVEVRLPAVILDDTPALEATARAASGRTRRVLIVDDNADAARSLALLIEAMGGAAVVAGDGTTGLARALELRPDIVLLDLGMPGLDGFETCRRMRAELANSVQIIAITGWGKDEDKQRAREAGFDAHITKPPDPALLRGYLR